MLNTIFNIEIPHRGKLQSFDAEFIPTSFSYRINVDINGSIVSFEPDEERNFRALLQSGQENNFDATDQEMVKKVAAKLEEIFRG